MAHPQQRAADEPHERYGERQHRHGQDGRRGRPVSHAGVAFLRQHHPRPPHRVRLVRCRLQVVAGVGEVEALVGQREVGHDRVGQRDRQGGPVEEDGSTILTRVSSPSGPSSTRCTIVPRQPSTMPTPEPAAPPPSPAVVVVPLGGVVSRWRPSSCSTQAVIIATDAVISSARTRNRASTSPSVRVCTVRGCGAARDGVVVAGVDGSGRWPGRRSRACRGRRPARRVSTAVPVNRSRTTLWSRASADDLARRRRRSRAARRGRAAGGRRRRRDGSAPRSSRCPVTWSLMRSSCSRMRCGVGVEDAVADVVAQRADVGDVVVEPFQLQQDRPDPLGVIADRPLIGRPRRPGRTPARARRRCRR